MEPLENEILEVIQEVSHNCTWSGNHCGLHVAAQGKMHLQTVAELLEAASPSQSNGMHQGPAVDDARKVPLNLESLLPPPVIDCDMQCVQLMTSRVAKWWGLLAVPWPDFSLAFDAANIRFHESTVAALTLARPSEDMPLPRHLHLYTDGSEKAEDTGWAAAIVQWDSAASAVAFLGAFGGKVELGETSRCYVGATARDSRNAELTALLWSMMWLIGQWASFSVCSASLHFDSTTAGFAANGHWSTGQDGLAQKARHLAQACETCCSMGPWEHVKAHAGHPWNECADTIAEAMCCNAAPTVCQPRLPDGVELGAEDISRLHMTVPSWDAHAFPRTLDGVANWREGVQRLTEMRPEQVVPFACRELSQAWDLNVRCVTVNVQSAVGKHAYLEQQFEDACIAIAFLQEMKEKAGLVKSARYLRFGTDSETHWGVAIWISRVTPLGWVDSTPVFADETSINVISAGPRHLVLNVAVRGERFCLTCAHFPHQGGPEAERTQLQDILDAAWRQAKCSVMLMGCDANARSLLGTVMCLETGS